jgi:hypothetical protein
MSSKKTEVATVNETPVTTIAAINANSNTDISAAFAAAKNVSVNDMIAETGQYMKFETGESYMLLVVGLTEMEDTINNTGMIEVADLITESGDRVINADVVMVSTVRKLIAKNVVPCVVYVFAKGTAGKAGAQYKDLDIRRVPTTTA